VVKKTTIWRLVVLQGLFALCASSILLYQYMGWHDFGFSLISYRVFNIVISIALVVYFIYGLFKQHRYILIGLGLFALFHTIEGIPTELWIKVVLNGLTLVLIATRGLLRQSLFLTPEMEHRS